MPVPSPEAVATEPPTSATDGSSPLLWDGLAGVFSWEAFRACAELAVAHTLRREGSLSLLVVGLDLSMDSALPSRGAFAEAMRLAENVFLRTARAGDLVGRHGATSFVVAAQDAQQAGVLRLAARIQPALSEQFKLVDPALRCDVAIGVASFPQAGRTFTELLESAMQASRRAAAAGRNRVVVGGAQAGGAADLNARYASPPASPSYDQLTIRRRAGFRFLTQAVTRGEIEGISVQPLPSACPVCLDAARDIYRPGWAPELPLAGCTGPVGCRCVFGSPALDSARRQGSGIGWSGRLDDLPRKLRDAASIGGDPRRTCKPEELAEYLETFGLLPIEADLGLPPPGESVYLARPARRAWDGTVAPRAATGPALPVATPLLPWVKRTTRFPTLPSDALQYPEDGPLYLTSQRLLFGRPGTLESILLTDLLNIECFRDALAFTVSGFGNRLIFSVRDPMPVGLYIVRAVRDVLLSAR